MDQVNYPIYAFDGFDLGIYAQIAGLYALEQQDVEAGWYTCFDSEGYLVNIGFHGPDVIVSRGPQQLDDFRQRLFKSLRAVHPDEAIETSLNELKRRAREVFGLVVVNQEI